MRMVRLKPEEHEALKEAAADLERVRNYVEPYKEAPTDLVKLKKVWRAMRQLLYGTKNGLRAEEKEKTDGDAVESTLP